MHIHWIWVSFLDSTKYTQFNYWSFACITGVSDSYMYIRAHVQMLLVRKASWLEGRWWTWFYFVLSSSKSSLIKVSQGFVWCLLIKVTLPCCMYEVRDEQGLNSFAWLGFLSRAGRCRGDVWSNFVLTVVEQCLLLSVLCLTLIVSVEQLGPGPRNSVWARLLFLMLH